MPGGRGSSARGSCLLIRGFAVRTSCCPFPSISGTGPGSHGWYEVMRSDRYFQQVGSLKVSLSNLAFKQQVCSQQSHAELCSCAADAETKGLGTCAFCRHLEVLKILLCYPPSRYCGTIGCCCFHEINFLPIQCSQMGSLLFLWQRTVKVIKVLKRSL